MKLLEEDRYSFRMPNGKLPMSKGSLNWMRDLKQAKAEAKSWGALTLVVLRQSEGKGWHIVEEIPLENH